MIKNEIDKIVNKFLNNESIAFDLIQQYGNEAFESELITLADNAVYDSLNCTLPREKKGLVAVALTMIAIRYYDGNMWDHIRDVFELTYDGDFNLKADAKIRSILQLFKKDCNYSNPDSLIAVPLTAACVTHYWLPPFFDFCFTIYKENLLARRDIYETELQTELQTTFESMRLNNHLSETDDYVRFGTTKSYKLSKFTQSALLTGTNTEGLACIGAYCIRSIIKCLNKENFRIHPYYSDAFETWKSNFYLNKSERAKLTDSGNWKITLRYADNNFYIVTKTEKVPETCDPRLIKIQILENGNIIKETDDVAVTYGIGSFLVGSKQIKLDCNILNKPSYRIVCRGEVLFDCEDKIYKNHEVYFFNEHGEQINSGSDYFGSLICITREQPAKCSNCLQFEGFYVSTVEVVPSGDYVFDGKHYAFKTIRRPGLEGNKCSGVKIKPNVDNEYYEIYNSINSILVETRLDKKDIYVLIDGKEIEINDLETVDYPVLDNGVRQFKILLPSIGPGMHLASVNSVESRKPLGKCSFEFILDKSFKKMCEYTGGGKYLLSVNSSFVNDKKEIEAGTLSVDFRCYVSGRGISTLTVYPEIISASLDGTHWLISGERLSSRKLNPGKPILFVTGPEGLNVTATSNNRTIWLPLIKSNEKANTYELNIGAVLALDSLDVQKARITIQNENNRYDLFVDFVTYIDLANSRFEYNRKNDIHFFRFSYVKEKEIRCDIIDVVTKRVAYTNTIEPNVQFSPTNLRAFTSYKIVLSEKGNGMFAKERVVAEIPYFFANAKELLGHVFEVHAVEFYGSNDQIIRKNISGNGTTLKFLSINRDNREAYIGSLRRIGEYSVDELKPLGLLNISTEAEFENDKLWVYINDLRDDDQLLFDIAHRRIFRSNQITPETKNMPGIERYLIKHI